jgi:GNAT superfamily N-acetyltransferase
MGRTPVDDVAVADRVDSVSPVGPGCAAQTGRVPSPVASAGMLREGDSGDADRIREFVCGLSPNSLYLRFFAVAAPPSAGLLRVLCGGTGADILLVTDSAGSVIAHGMAADVTVSGGQASNIGLVVADRWQRQGLGRLLLSTLVSRAYQRGVGSLVLDVLPANDVMLGIIGRRWPDAPRERTRDAIVISPAITPSQAAAGRTVPAVLTLAPNHQHRKSGELHAARRTAA